MNITSYKKIDLLTEEQEKELFQIITSFKNSENPHENRSYRKAVDIIVTKHIPVVRGCVKELSGYRGIDPEELFSEGVMALVKAVERFEPEKENRFSTYAGSCVRGSMFGFILKNNFIVNPCTNIKAKKLFFALRKTIARATRELGSFEMTPELLKDLVEKFEMSEKEILMMESMLKNPYDSLSTPVSHEDETVTMEDFIESAEDTPEEMLNNAITSQLYRDLIKIAIEEVLTEREKDIFISQELQYSEDTKTLEELGNKWSISKERVRQLRNSAFEKVSKCVKRMMREQNISASDLI